MRRFTQQRQRAHSLKMSELGKKSKAVQRARREAEITHEMRMDMQANPPLRRGDFDRMMIGRITDDRRYLGNGAWEKVNVESSRLNEVREGRQ